MNRIPKPDNDDSEPPRMALAGHLLVAAPQVEEEMFCRSVCLILDHQAAKTVGVLLNRRFSLDVGPLWEHLTEGLTKTAAAPDHLNFGGPNSGPVVAIHNRPHLAEGGNGNGVFLAAQVETLKKLAFVPPADYRLYVGHALWKGGQLEKEIMEGKWFPILASPDLVFVDDYDMWEVGMRRVGSQMIQSFLSLKDLPSCPSLN
jgi:putative transcriptional regulator